MVDKEHFKATQDVLNRLKLSRYVENEPKGSWENDFTSTASLLGHHNYLPAFNAWIDRKFSYYALNFCRSGAFYGRWVMEEPAAIPQRPCGLVDVPGRRYVYARRVTRNGNTFS
jgi:hypothetical protein